MCTYNYIYIYIYTFFGFSTCLSARRRPPAPRETPAVLAPPAECLVLLRRRLGVLVSELWQDGKMMGTVCWKAMESLGLEGSTLWFPVFFFPQTNPLRCFAGGMAICGQPQQRYEANWDLNMVMYSPGEFRNIITSGKFV